MNFLRRFSLAALLMGVVLTGCAAPPPPPQAAVQVFTPPGLIAPGAAYRYERLPSQANRADSSMFDGVADIALARAGLRRDDENPSLSVQLTVQEGPTVYGAAPPAWGSVGIGGSNWGRGSAGGVGLGLSFPIGGGPAYPLLTVDLVIRNVSGGQVVFQSHASSASGANVAALLDVMLRDFPNAPPGGRVYQVR